MSRTLKLASLIAAVALTIAPISSASAHGWDHGGGWHGGGWGHGGGYYHDGFFAGLFGAAATVAVAPFALAGAIVAPQPVYYAPHPHYYYAPRPVYYGGYPGYYPAPVYAAPPMAYYGQ